jgi:hypothetical protein
VYKESAVVCDGRGIPALPVAQGKGSLLPIPWHQRRLATESLAMSDVTERDARQIEQVLYLYAWMVDKRDWGLIDQVFTADATIDYASTGGPGRLPHREALKWLDGALQAWPINLHHITNIMPQVAGDRGRCRCYFFAPMGRPKPGGGYFAQEIVTNAGFYHDQLVRSARGWRISERVCEMTVMIGTLPADHSIPAVQG